MNKIVYIFIVPLIILTSNFFFSQAFPIEDLKISDHLGTPWKREAALWIKDNTSADADILTARMPTANILKFYSNHDVYTLEINRNPTYLQVDNPILLILNNNVTIIVEDLDPEYIRKPLSLELRKYLEFFDPELIYTGYKHEREGDSDNLVPMIKVYQLE
jgi:hypothetical protein